MLFQAANEAADRCLFERPFPASGPRRPACCRLWRSLTNDVGRSSMLVIRAQERRRSEDREGERETHRETERERERERRTRILVQAATQGNIVKFPAQDGVNLSRLETRPRESRSEGKEMTRYIPVSVRSTQKTLTPSLPSSTSSVACSCTPFSTERVANITLRVRTVLTCPGDPSRGSPWSAPKNTWAQDKQGDSAYCTKKLTVKLVRPAADRPSDRLSDSYEELHPPVVGGFSVELAYPVRDLCHNGIVRRV